MTEEEARTKWCPFVRVTFTTSDLTWQGDMVTNRGQKPSSKTDALCIASDCMAWAEETLGRTNDREIKAGYCQLMRKS